MTTKIAAGEIRVGDIIRPPAREMRLWMRRDAMARGLDDAALAMTVLEVSTDADAAGPLVRFSATMSDAWHAGKPGTNRPWRFHARPTTRWEMLARASA